MGCFLKEVTFESVNGINKTMGSYLFGQYGVMNE